ncbi:M1 family metallopeptidase [Gaetbulibacter aquiaggeris]|uniref:M1 family metallopeptidase n=1 Tax=Gaetbulibacter aquiaggeris TaxID=1735373 RepID=A0ABW7MPE7_9FLAO
MILKKSILLATLLFISITSVAQDLYTPRDVKQAYKNNTRSKDGMPGTNYWQNRASYKIKIQVAPPNKSIIGTEEIVYTNNSPDTLTILNYKLIVNVHKPGAVRLNPVSTDYLTSGIHIDKYIENGEEKMWDDSNDGTNKLIQLSKPLFPKGKIKLDINWHYDLSAQSDREGAIDSTTFFLAYFYPRIAVYDDYQGWDMMTFTDSQEFYNDFNDYEFEVTVPKNFIVWATGDLLNPEDVLQNEYAERLKKSMTSDEIIKVATQEDLKKNQITKQTDTNTWKWTASDISDIAIAVSNTFNWDAGSVVADSSSNRQVSVQAAYDEKSKDFKEMVNYGKHAIDWFSNNYPGVSYPFSKSTIVRGFSDMEYPMMVNDNSQLDPNITRSIVDHEIAHSYFPFYMGINETRFGFMDEGWATALEYLIGISYLGEERATSDFKLYRVDEWINDNSMDRDIPIITPSNILSGVALNNNVYVKAAIGYLALKDLLGDDAFKLALQGYMDRWHGKHPIPWDFFYSINNISETNLNWFWNSWFFSNNYIDIAIKHIETNKNITTLKLENIGGMPVPFNIILTFKDGTAKTIHQTPDVWKNNVTEVSVTLKSDKDISIIKIDGGIFMDADMSNNTWEK